MAAGFDGGALKSAFKTKVTVKAMIAAANNQPRIQVCFFGVGGQGT